MSSKSRSSGFTNLEVVEKDKILPVFLVVTIEWMFQSRLWRRCDCDRCGEGKLLSHLPATSACATHLE